MLDLRPLHTGDIRHLALAYWINEFGNWIGEIALTLLVYGRTGSVLATAALFLGLRLVPSALAPLVTVRVETLPARTALTVMYVVEAVLLTALAWLTHHFSLPLVLALASVDALLAVTAKGLTRGITANRLLKRKLLRAGNGILNLGAMASTAGAPLIAGALFAWKGPGVALLADAATFLATAALIASAPPLGGDHKHSERFRARLDDAVLALRANAALHRLLIAVSLVILAGSLPIPVDVVFAKQTLHAGSAGYGILLGSWGAGMLLGAAAFAFGGHRQLAPPLVGGAGLTVVAYAGLAAAPGLAIACAASVVGGAGNSASWVAALTMIQERVPLTAQSTIMSVLEGLNQLVPAIGIVAGGLIVVAASPRVAYAAAAAGILAVLITASAGARPLAAEPRRAEVKNSAPTADKPEELQDNWSRSENTATPR